MLEIQTFSFRIECVRQDFLTFLRTVNTFGCYWSRGCGQSVSPLTPNQTTLQKKTLLAYISVDKLLPSLLFHYKCEKAAVYSKQTLHPQCTVDVALIRAYSLFNTYCSYLCITALTKYALLHTQYAYNWDTLPLLSPISTHVVVGSGDVTYLLL